MLIRSVLLGFGVVTAALLLPAVASAHVGEATAVCKNSTTVAVTYSGYASFGSGTQKVLETAYVNGTQGAQTTFQFTGPSTSKKSVLDVSVPAGQNTIEADAYSINEGQEVDNFPFYFKLTCQQKPPPPVCPSGTKLNFQWHFIANGSSGSWSATKSVTCPGTVTIPPQTWGSQTVPAGSYITVGYNVTAPGSPTLSANITPTFNITGSCPFTVTEPETTINGISGGGWVEEEYRVQVPTSCGSTVTVNGGSFSASVS